MTPLNVKESMQVKELDNCKGELYVFTEVSHFYQGFSFNSQKTNSASKLVFSESVHGVFPALTICSTSNTP
jgi:hypothetical protein